MIAEDWGDRRYKVVVVAGGQTVERIGFTEKPSDGETHALGRHLATKWGEGAVVLMNWAAVPVPTAPLER